MKKIIGILCVWMSTGVVWSQEISSCAQGLSGFICKDSVGKVINRCGTGTNSYDLKENGVTYRCVAVGLPTDTAKKAFVGLVKKPSEKNLEQFKSACDFSSPLNLANDVDVQDSIRTLTQMGGVDGIRALIFAESHCADPVNHEVILSWLGNELLIRHAAEVMKAFSKEEKNPHLIELAKMDPVEWRGTECKTDSCRMKRNTHLVSKIDAIEDAKITKSLKPIQQELLRTLQEVNDSAKHAFLVLMQQTDEKHLAAYKKSCNITSPMDFVADGELYSAVENILKTGNALLIRAMIYTDSHCADISNRKMILSWLGNEILIAHAAEFITALSLEDPHHDFYDIAEVESKEWRETKCFDDPCLQNRKNYFATKRKALETAMIEAKMEPIRKQLLKYLISDQ